MRWSSFAFLAASQSPLVTRPPTDNLNVNSHSPTGSSLSESSFSVMSMQQQPNAFAFKTGSDRFSPDDLVQLGRPSAAVANQAGDLVLSTLTKFNISSKKNKKTAFIIPAVENPSTAPLEIPLEKTESVFWLDGVNLAKAVQSEEKKETRLYLISIAFDAQSGTLSFSSSLDKPAHLGTIPTNSAGNFVYEPVIGYLVFTDYVHSDGKLSTVNSQDEEWENRGNTAYVYDTTYERHWDTWTGPKRSSIFSVKLAKNPDHEWEMGGEFYNVLRKGDGHSSPVEPFGGTDHFDVLGRSVVYMCKDPKSLDSMHTKTNVYIVDIQGHQKPLELTSGDHGATSSPVFSPDGKKVAWLQMDEDGYEADRNKIVIADLERDVKFNLAEDWDRSPDALTWSKSGGFLYFTATEDAKIKTWVLPVPQTHRTSPPSVPKKFTSPIVLTSDGAASGIQALPYGRVLISKSTYTTPNEFYLITGLSELETSIDSITGDDEVVDYKGSVIKLPSLVASDDSLRGKSLSVGESFYFKGHGDTTVQGWVLRPYGYSEELKAQGKKWPVVFLIHGGPQGAWEDQWSTRWNPNVWAGQGYFIVMINPRGSTGFGQEFTNGISEDWGGKVFVDLQKGWQYALQNYPEIDADRAAAAGASWGGYAINWIQGHPEYNFGFKAMVCHDGVFDSPYNGYSTEELFFFNHEFGGPPFSKKGRELSERFTPSNYVDKWSVPQLVIHGSKDYRLPETDGIGAFHALQQMGVPSRLVIFPDENHWVLKHGNSLKWHYEVFRWIDQYIGDSKA